MKIPKKVIIAGIEWAVEICGTLYNVTTSHPLYAQVNFTETKIIVSTQSGCMEDGRDVSYPIQHNIQVATFFHEIWHIYCDMIVSKKLNEERNCNMFGYIMLGIMDDDKDSENMPVSSNYNQALDQMNSWGIGIKDAEVNLLKFMMYNTTFIYE